MCLTRPRVYGQSVWPLKYHAFSIFSLKTRNIWSHLVAGNHSVLYYSFILLRLVSFHHGVLALLQILLFCAFMSVSLWRQRRAIIRSLYLRRYRGAAGLSWWSHIEQVIHLMYLSRLVGIWLISVLFVGKLKSKCDDWKKKKSEKYKWKRKKPKWFVLL